MLLAGMPGSMGIEGLKYVCFIIITLLLAVLEGSLPGNLCSGGYQLYQPGNGNERS